MCTQRGNPDEPDAQQVRTQCTNDAMIHRLRA